MIYVFRYLFSIHGIITSCEKKKKKKNTALTDYVQITIVIYSETYIVYFEVI